QPAEEVRRRCHRVQNGGGFRRDAGSGHLCPLEPGLSRRRQAGRSVRCGGQSVEFAQHQRPGEANRTGQEGGNRKKKGSGRFWYAAPAETIANGFMSALAESLEGLLGHRFQNHSLLRRALTHKSRVYERSSQEDASADNEQFEFLGDSILG